MTSQSSNNLGPRRSTKQLAAIRDQQILHALAQGPLTTKQLLKHSNTFIRPFEDEGVLRRRLRRLQTVGHIKTYKYPTTDALVLNYYKLTRSGYRQLNGPKATLPGNSFFEPVSKSLVDHTRDLADVTVHTRVHAHRCGYDVVNEYRENELELTVDGQKRKPDRAFTLVANQQMYHCLVELDESTEQLLYRKDADSLEEKVRFYEHLQNQRNQRFRVLFLFAKPGPRMMNFLDLVARLADRRRRLVYAALLSNYLANDDPLRWPLFLDHFGDYRPLVKGKYQPIKASPQKILADPLPVW